MPLPKHFKVIGAGYYADGTIKYLDIEYERPGRAELIGSMLQVILWRGPGSMPLPDSATSHYEYIRPEDAPGPDHPALQTQQVFPRRAGKTAIAMMLGATATAGPLTALGAPTSAAPSTDPPTPPGDRGDPSSQ